MHMLIKDSLPDDIAILAATHFVEKDSGFLCNGGK